MWSSASATTPVTTGILGAYENPPHQAGLRMSQATAASHNDKFVTALFVAGLLHGVLILGVSFEFLPRADFVGSPTLEVILVEDPKQSDLAPDDAHYLSEQNQSGSGTTKEKIRAESRLSSNSPVPNAGAETGTALESRQAVSVASMSLIVTRSLSERSLRSLRDRKSEDQERQEARRLDPDDVTPDLISEYDEETRIHSPELRELFISVNTRKTILARYLTLWKRKIEQVGTLNFPDQSLLDGLSGNPTLEVAIAADGNLIDVILKKTSGEPRIDQSAINIVRLASPFDKFPDDVRAEYDVMRFVYVWQFVDGKRENSAVKLDTEN